MTTLLTLSQDLSDLVAQTEPSIVAIHGKRFQASGIHWQAGMIVTSCESINLDDTLSVTLPDRQTVAATIVGADPTTDIAVLQVPTDSELGVPRLSQTVPLSVGSLALALGRSPEGSNFAHFGMVQMLGESWRSRSGGVIDQFIRVNLNLSRSGAGGALINMAGELVGFNTFGLRRQVLTIPVQTIRRVIQQLQEKGHIPRGYLGISMQTVQLPEDLQQRLNLTHPGGIMILGLEPHAAAAQAGLLLGDILVAANEQMIQSPQDLQMLLDAHSIGQSLTVRFIRAGVLQQTTLVVGERPTVQ